MTEFVQLVQQWFAFSVVLAAQLLLVLALRKPVRARFGAVACYRLWLLPAVWLPLYFLGPSLLATLATPAPFGGAPGTATPYQQALQSFVEIELLPFDLDYAGSTALAAGGDATIQGWSVLAVLWAAGTVALVFWHGRRWLDFSRKVRAAGLPLSATEKAYTGTTAHFAPELPVLRVNAMTSAALFGVFKPVLLLPGAFTQRYDEAQRHIILAHEAVHLRRGDNGWNLFVLLLIALFWINPLVFIAWRYFRLDQELSCDALALARCSKEQQKRYARTLLDSLGTLPVRGHQPALSAWDNLGDIKARSMMVSQHMHLARRPVATLLSLVALATLGASLTVAFADLVSPVVQAAEPERAPQAVQLTQEAQRAVQLAQQQLQDVQQGVQMAQRRVAAAQQDVETSRERAQAVQQDVQSAQRRAQDVQQDVRATQRQVQEVRQDVQAAQQWASEVQQDVQAAQQRAEQVQQDVQAAQQRVQAAEQNVQATQQAVQAVQQDVQAAQQAVQAAQQQLDDSPRAAPAGSDRGQDNDEARVRPQDISAQTAQALSAAIQFLNNSQFAEARARLADLPVQRLSPFERSRFEQLMFNLDMADENFAGARNHLQAALDSRGLSVQEASQMRYQLAQLLVQEEKYADAVVALEAWIASAPAANGAAYYLLAASHYYLGQYAAALPYAEKADAFDQDTGVVVEAHMALLAALYERLGRAADAERMQASIATLFVRAETPQVQPDPVPEARVSPDYPRRALQLGIEGWVKVRFTVSETGEVVDPVVVDSRPKRVFDNAAIRAISNWRYTPATEDTVAVQHPGLETTFRFTLADI